MTDEYEIRIGNSVYYGELFTEADLNRAILADERNRKRKKSILRHINPGNCFIVLFAIALAILIWYGYIASHGGG